MPGMPPFPPGGAMPPFPPGGAMPPFPPAGMPPFPPGGGMPGFPPPGMMGGPPGGMMGGPPGGMPGMHGPPPSFSSAPPPSFVPSSTNTPPAASPSGPRPLQVPSTGTKQTNSTFKKPTALKWADANFSPVGFSLPVVYIQELTIFCRTRCVPGTRSIMWPRKAPTARMGRAREGRSVRGRRTSFRCSDYGEELWDHQSVPSNYVPRYMEKVTHAVPSFQSALGIMDWYEIFFCYM